MIAPSSDSVRASSSAGVLQPSVLRGLPLSRSCALATSPSVTREKSVPLGKNCRSRPLAFSLVPRCQGLLGSQKPHQRDERDGALPVLTTVHDRPSPGVVQSNLESAPRSVTTISRDSTSGQPPDVHHPRLEEFDRFEMQIRTILAQRLGLGEIRVRNVPAREKRREGSTRLPAETPRPSPARTGEFLPSRDVARKCGRFRAPTARFLPSEDDGQVLRRNVPASENYCHQIRQPLPSKDDARTDAAHQPNLGESPRPRAGSLPRPDNARARAAQYPDLPERCFIK